MKTGYLELCTKLKLEWHWLVPTAHSAEEASVYLHRHCGNHTWWEGTSTLCCYSCHSLAGLRAGFKAHSCTYSKPLKYQNVLCQKPECWPTPLLPEQRFFSPNELSVQQTIHFDQPVTSDITEMAELSQQQKPDDTQSLLYAQPLVSEINKLQTLVNRSLLKTQTGTYIS